VRPGRELGLGYDDRAVVELAARDGQAAFNTKRWGANRALHGLLAVLITAVTHGAAVRVRVEEELVGIAAAYADAREKFRVERIMAYAALTQVTLAAARRRELTKKLADHKLGEPTSRWPVLLFLLLVTLGDLTMTAAAMAVLNLSDRPYWSGLPFTELHLAASAAVVGMIGAAHFLGETLKAHHYEKDLRSVLKIVAGVSVAGGLGLALSIAALRTAFLRSNGVPAQSVIFVGLQVGLFAVAVAASIWTAHPYGPAWRQMERQERRADRRYTPARRRAGERAAVLNALVARWVYVVAAARAGVEAVASDARRQGHLFLRELQHGQPEPTEEELYAGELPEPAWPKSVQELRGDSEAAEGSSLAVPESVNLDDLDDEWEQLRQQRVTAVGSDADMDGEGPEPTGLHPVADDPDASPRPGAA
jgi:hypothetical protein